MNLSQNNFSRKYIICLLVAVIFLSSAAVAKEIPKSNQKIDLNLKGVDLKDAFRALADIAGINIIADSSVKGVVTTNLKNMSVKRAIKLLAKTNNLSYRVEDNTIIIAGANKLKKGFENKITRVFELKNSKPKELKKTLNLLVEDSSIKVDKRTDSLVITTYQSELSRIEKTINSLDKAKKQIVLEARIEEVSRNELEKLGISWDEISNVDDSSDTIKMLHDTIKTSAGSSDNTGASTFEGEITNSTGGVKYTAILEALEADGKADLLANPKIATLDGKEANIMIGTKVPLFEIEEDDETGETTQKFDEYKEVGIKLNIVPRVVGDKITVKVKPEVSTITSFKGEHDEVPVINTREAETNIRIEDGKTIALGGLIKEEELEKLSKVPMLGDIPILGKLFQKKETDLQKRELVIFITPRIIGDSGDDGVNNSKNKASDNSTNQTNTNKKAKKSKTVNTKNEESSSESEEEKQEKKSKSKEKTDNNQE